MNPITAAALGAGMMYLFDPDEGRARRDRIQDKCRGLVQQSKDEFDLSVRDLKMRAESCARDIRTAMADGEPAEGIQAVRNELTQWTPATRLLAAAGGGALAACVLGAISPRTLALAGLGAGVCAAVMNRERLEQIASEAMIEAGSAGGETGEAGFEVEEIDEPVRATRK